MYLKDYFKMQWKLKKLNSIGKLDKRIKLPKNAHLSQLLLQQINLKSFLIFIYLLNYIPPPSFSSFSLFTTFKNKYNFNFIHL